METKSIRVLHTDLTVTIQTLNVRKNGILTNAVASVGTALRKNDNTVAAIRVDGVNNYQWVGHASKSQLEAVALSERNGFNW